jgi:hypothetical protein
MPSSVSDWVTSLAPVAVMSAAFIYGGAVHVRSKYRRRRGIVAPNVMPVYRPRAELEARVVRDQLVAREVNRVLDPALERLSPLYEQASADAEDHAREAAEFLAQRAQANALYHP